MKPDFVIIGAQKSGSTSLMRQIREHPQIYMPKAETRYFRDPWYHVQSATELERVLKPARRSVLRYGIRSPDLLALPSAPERIHRELPSAQLIAILRQPVDRAISAYFWYMQWGWIPISPPAEGLRKLLNGDYQSAYPRSAEILEYGLYAQQLERYLDRFPRDRIKIILTDELRDEPQRVEVGVFQFLGVDPQFRPSAGTQTRNEGVYSDRRLRVLRLRHRYILREYPGFAGTYVERPNSVVGWLVDRGIAAIDRIVLARLISNARPPIDDELKAQLAAYYATDVAELERMLGRNLRSWRQPAHDA